MANGYILFEGQSMIDGQDIVMIATGFDKGSKNSKTGSMIQTWILCKDIDPREANKLGLDYSICGDCKLRGVAVDASISYEAIADLPKLSTTVTVSIPNGTLSIVKI